MYLTRNQAWARVHRGFESHPLRQIQNKNPAIYCGVFIFVAKRARMQIIFPLADDSREVVGGTLYTNITGLNTIGFLEKKYAIDT